MASQAQRIERDTLGEIAVPDEALYGAQTQRAVENFGIGGQRLPAVFIHAVAAVKAACAAVNRELGVLEPAIANAIEETARQVEEGAYDDQFPVDVYQTGSGTSTNMNVNEVIATLAARKLGRAVHPNDHVNRSQSSNDVIPTAIHVSAYRESRQCAIPGLEYLGRCLASKAGELRQVVKTGRTHLMDALPIRMGQELEGWKAQIACGEESVRTAMRGLARLAIGGTAVGTGANAPPGFGRLVAAVLAERTGIPFVVTDNHFAALSGLEHCVTLSGALRTAAVSLTKIANDLRWMNSGPLAGLAEIQLPALQPGSSIMPAKVNPVIAEAAAMACARVIGNDVTLAIAGQSGSFQLNTMLPLAAYCLLESIKLVGNSARALADKAILGFTVNEERLRDLALRNPLLATALTPRIGYERTAKIVQEALETGLPVREIARRRTELPREEIDRLLDPQTLAGGESVE